MWQKLSKSALVNPKSLYSDSNKKIPDSLYMELKRKQI